MLYYSLYLTIIVIFAVITMFVFTAIYCGITMHFKKQQISLAKAEGYIQEMMSGLKVVKVFNYEENLLEKF